jgi:AICAR transformylase/IMP cyclohydrolase PurH
MRRAILSVSDKTGLIPFGKRSRRAGSSWFDRRHGQALADAGLPVSTSATSPVSRK